MPGAPNKGRENQRELLKTEGACEVLVAGSRNAARKSKKLVKGDGEGMWARIRKYSREMSGWLWDVDLRLKNKPRRRESNVFSRKEVEVQERERRVSSAKKVRIRNTGKGER